MRKSIVFVVAALVAALSPALRAGAEGDVVASVPVPVKTYYLHTATQANADQVTRTAGAADGPTMDQNAPTKPASNAGVTFLGNGSVQNGPYQPIWKGEVVGTVIGGTVTFWASSPAYEQVRVSLYADGSDTAFANSTVTVTPSAEPVKYEAPFPGISQAVTGSVLVQFNSVSPSLSTATQRQLGRVPAAIYFDSVDTPSSFRFGLGELPPVAGGDLAFVSYATPGSFESAHGPNETSIGVNPHTGAVMFQLRLSTARVTFDDTVSPPKATWTDVSSPYTSVETLDPMLWTDPVNGRTFVQQLLGTHSVTVYTDDDGETWTPVQPASVAPSADHQTISGGPYAPGMTSEYGRAIYYCAQGVIIAQCARSDDGGTTWGAPIPFNYADCVGLHGRVVVGPTGTVYVPQRSCERNLGVVAIGAGPYQGVFASDDNGLTWRLTLHPSLPSGASDPSIALDKAGRLYFATSSDGKLQVTTSDDQARTFNPPVDVSSQLGLKNVQFASAVAGDAGRAAVSFYGAKEEGDDQAASYKGEWHMYVSTTIDGGLTWTTVDITPDDPVQRGYICLSGTTCTAGRNLLDFQSMTIDPAGRILVGYADGCTTPACIAAEGKTNAEAGSTDSLGMIARQVSGPRMYLEATTPPTTQ